MDSILGSTEGIATILDAVAKFAWPAVVVFALVYFRGSFQEMFGRLRKGKGPGGWEVELEAASTKAFEASESLPEQPVEIVSYFADHREAQVRDRDLQLQEKSERRRELLGLVEATPRGAVMEISAQIERNSREVLSGTAPKESVRMPFGHAIRLLDLSPSLQDAAHQFRQVRNRIAHGVDASEAEIWWAVDIGLTILDALDNIPHEVNFVIASDVACFADSEGEVKHDFTAVLLEARTPNREAMTRAFPTQSRLPVGDPVSWEWGDTVYPEAWILNPASGSREYGWTSSLEFTGRPLHPRA